MADDTAWERYRDRYRELVPLLVLDQCEHFCTIGPISPGPVSMQCELAITGNACTAIVL